MMLTDTSLGLAEANHALARWDLQVSADELAPGSGTANASVILRTPRGKLLLKRRNPRYDREEWVRFEHALMEHLRAREMPTPLALPTSEGARWARLDDSVYELYPYIEGEEHVAGNAKQIASAGEMLARFQEATSDFEPPCEKAWERYHSPEKIAKGLVGIMGRVGDELPDVLEGGRLNLGPVLSLSEAVLTVGSLLERLPDESYWALPQTIVHGDYHPANLKFRGDEVVGIFDLDWCTRQPRMVDLADGLLFFCGWRREPVIPGDIWSLTQSFRMSAKLVRAFGAAYTSVITPTKEELRALPDLMRARWLYCRVDAMQRKVRRERQLEFLLRGLLGPLHWINEHEGRIADGTLLRL